MTWLKFISPCFASQIKTALGRLAASSVLKQELLTALLTHQVQELSASQEFWSPCSALHSSEVLPNFSERIVSKSGCIYFGSSWTGSSSCLASQIKTAFGRLAASSVLKQELLTALLTHQVQELSASQEFWSPCSALHSSEVLPNFSDRIL